MVKIILPQNPTMTLNGAIVGGLIGGIVVFLSRQELSGRDIFSATFGISCSAVAGYVLTEPDEEDEGS